MTKRLRFFTLTVLLGASVAAQASLLGFYGKFQGGYADATLKKSSDSEGVVAGKLSLSYQPNPGYELELGYLLSRRGPLKNSIEGAYKFLLPLSNNLNSYAKLGLAWKTKLWAPGFGLGASYNIRPDILLEIGWTRSYIPKTHWLNGAGKPRGHVDFILMGVGFYWG